MVFVSINIVSDRENMPNVTSNCIRLIKRLVLHIASYRYQSDVGGSGYNP